jgi:hypothetical protein
VCAHTHANGHAQASKAFLRLEFLHVLCDSEFAAHLALPLPSTTTVLARSLSSHVLAAASDWTSAHLRRHPLPAIMARTVLLTLRQVRQCVRAAASADGARQAARRRGGATCRHRCRARRAREACIRPTIRHRCCTRARACVSVVDALAGVPRERLASCDLVLIALLVDQVLCESVCARLR